MDDLPITAEQERQTRRETRELWARYRLMRRNYHLATTNEDRQQYRNCCKLALRQLHAVIRQDWPDPKPTPYPWFGVTEAAPYKSPYKGWTPPAVRGRSGRGVAVHLPWHIRDEARTYWEWVQRWQAGEAEILPYTWEED